MFIMDFVWAMAFDYNFNVNFSTLACGFYVHSGFRGFCGFRY